MFNFFREKIEINSPFLPFFSSLSFSRSNTTMEKDEPLVQAMRLLNALNLQKFATRSTFEVTEEELERIKTRANQYLPLGDSKEIARFFDSQDKETRKIIRDITGHVLQEATCQLVGRLLALDSDSTNDK